MGTVRGTGDFVTEHPPTIHDADALGVALPPHQPKPTSLDGQTESSHTLWESPDGLVEVGVWECTPGTFTAFRDGYDEVAHIHVGRATVTSETGDKAHLGPGSTLVTPAGWKGTWQVHETIRKTYILRTIH